MDAPAVAVSADGKKIASGWMDMRNRANDRDVWWVLPGRKAEVPLAEKTDGNQGNVSLAMDADATVYAAWHSDGKVVVCTSKDPKNDIISTESDANWPCVAVRGTAKVVVYQCARGVVLRTPFK
jgi:uncharacterized protein (DUF1684 family)